jgi:hypothetical protein
MIRLSALFIICFALATCNSASTAVTTPRYASITVNTFDYNPGNKTAVNVSIGGGPLAIAEIDSGSDLTVANESVVGPNIIKTSESATVSYGGGQNTVSGYIGYGSITFTTSNGSTISTNSNTPILVVESGSVDEGGGNNIILGMRMNNQVSSRLYLPYPYNQMMILNRAMGKIIFGNLTKSQVASFGTMQMVNSTCVNYNVPATSNNICYEVGDNSVNYTYQTGDIESTVTLKTIFDSGEANANFYFSPAPSWMVYDRDGVIQTPITASLNTSHGILPLPLPSVLYYDRDSGDTANPGNLYFNTYQVLFDQADGLTGFLESNASF